MSKQLIIYSENHQLSDRLRTLDGSVTFIEFFQNAPNYLNSELEYLYDFTLQGTQAKLEFYEQILVSHQKSLKIVGDFSVCHGQMIMELIPYVSGAMATHFYSPNGNYEYYLKDSAIKSNVDKLFSSLNISGLPSSEAGIGFIYPRTAAMIINEAFFALEDGLAKKEDIDSAMLFGVNYPIGPFELAKKVGAQAVVTLLNDLFLATGDARYRTCPLLKMQAAKEIQP